MGRMREMCGDGYSSADGDGNGNGDDRTKQQQPKPHLVLLEVLDHAQRVGGRDDWRVELHGDRLSGGDAAPCIVDARRERRRWSGERESARSASQYKILRQGSNSRRQARESKLQRTPCFFLCALSSHHSYRQCPRVHPPISRTFTGTLRCVRKSRVRAPLPVVVFGVRLSVRLPNIACWNLTTVHRTKYNSLQNILVKQIPYSLLHSLHGPATSECWN